MWYIVMFFVFAFIFLVALGIEAREKERKLLEKKYGKKSNINEISGYTIKMSG